MICCYFC